MTFIMPVEHHKLTSKYDKNRIHPVLKIKRMHAGVDLVNAKVTHAPIYAAAAGVVRLMKTTKDGYGKYIIIRHVFGDALYETVYAHLKSFSVKEGEYVKQGQQIGVMGNTGIGTGVHLHFEIHKGVYAFDNYTYPNSVDPWPYITGQKKVTVSKKATVKNDVAKVAVKSAATTKATSVSDACVELVKEFEGFRSTAYLDSANVWTIGYGTIKYANGKAVKKGDKITEVEAFKLLKKQLDEHASTIYTYVKVDLSQSQFDALASFQYNLGKHILKGSYLLTYINNKQWDKAANSMKQYNKARNAKNVLVEVKGLTTRRNKEAALFLKAVTKEDDDLKFANNDLKEAFEKRKVSPATKTEVLAAAKKYLKISKPKVEEGDIVALLLEVGMHLIKEEKKKK